MKQSQVVVFLGMILLVTLLAQESAAFHGPIPIPPVGKRKFRTEVGILWKILRLRTRKENCIKHKLRQRSEKVILKT